MTMAHLQFASAWMDDGCVEQLKGAVLAYIEIGPSSGTTHMGSLTITPGDPNIAGVMR